MAVAAPASHERGFGHDFLIHLTAFGDINTTQSTTCHFGQLDWWPHACGHTTGRGGADWDVCLVLLAGGGGLGRRDRACDQMPVKHPPVDEVALVLVVVPSNMRSSLKTQAQGPPPSSHFPLGAMSHPSPFSLAVRGLVPCHDATCHVEAPRAAARRAFAAGRCRIESRRHKRSTRAEIGAARQTAPRRGCTAVPAVLVCPCGSAAQVKHRFKHRRMALKKRETQISTD